MTLKLKQNPEAQWVLGLKGRVRAGLSWRFQAPDNGINWSERVFFFDPTPSPPLSCFQMKAEK